MLHVAENLTPEEAAQIEADSDFGGKVEKVTPVWEPTPEELGEETHAKEGEIPEAKEAEKEPDVIPEKSEDEKKAETEAKTAEDAKKAEEEKGAKEKVKFDLIERESKALAEEKKISVEEAKVIVQEEYDYAEKYQHDPIKLARTSRNIQSLYSKTEAKIKDMESKKLPENVIQTDDKSLVVTGKDGKTALWTYEKIVETYRKDVPEAENKTDEEVYGIVLKDIKKAHLEASKAISDKVEVDARIKRSEVLSKVPTEDKRFIPEIEKFISTLPDSRIVSENFDIKDVVTYIKGTRYEADLKKGIEEALVKDREQRTILGEKTPNIPKGKSAGKAPRVISESEKRRAEEMFSTTELTKEEMYKAYLELPDNKW